MFRGKGLLSVAGLGCLCAALFVVGLIWGLLGTGAALILIDAMREGHQTPVDRWHE
jgi:hypothetical protein